MSDTTTQKSMAIPLTALAAGAVIALLLGVFGRVHDPTLSGTTTLGFSTVLAMKTVVSTVIGVLVVVQVVQLGLLFIRHATRQWLASPPCAEVSSHACQNRMSRMWAVPSWPSNWSRRRS